MSDQNKMMGSTWNVKPESTRVTTYERNPSHASNVTGLRLAVDTLGPHAAVNTMGGSWLMNGPRRTMMGAEDHIDRGIRLDDMGIRLVFEPEWSDG